MGLGRNDFGFLFGGWRVEDDAGEGGGVECELLVGVKVLRTDGCSAKEVVEADR